MVRTLIVAFLAFFLGAVVAAPLHAQDKQHKKAKEGVVASVDGATVKLDGGATIATDDNTKVTRDGKPAKVADLQKGDKVKYFAEEGKSAAYIHAMHG